MFFKKFYIISFQTAEGEVFAAVTSHSISDTFIQLYKMNHVIIGVERISWWQYRKIKKFLDSVE